MASPVPFPGGVTLFMNPHMRILMHVLGVVNGKAEYGA